MDMFRYFVSGRYFLGVYSGLLLIAIYERGLQAEPISVSVMANIVIAGATIIAVFLQAHSISAQKKEKQWELNKEYVINFLKLFPEMKKTISDCIFNERRDMAIDAEIKIEGNIFFDFDKALEELLDVYSFLLKPDMVKELTSLRDRQIELSRQVNIEDMESVDAYESQLDAIVKLEKKLVKMMSDLFGFGK